ncbi:hypothetical protein P7C70_g5026, partial [Phenoliferia sp. Uapishka_3]
MTIEARSFLWPGDHSDRFAPASAATATASLAFTFKSTFCIDSTDGRREGEESWQRVRPPPPLLKNRGYGPLASSNSRRNPRPPSARSWLRRAPPQPLLLPLSFPAVRILGPSYSSRSRRRVRGTQSTEMPTLLTSMALGDHPTPAFPPHSPATTPFPLVFPIVFKSNTTRETDASEAMGVQASSGKLAAVAVLQAQLEAVANGTTSSRPASIIEGGTSNSQDQPLRQRGSSISSGHWIASPRGTNPVRTTSVGQPRSPRTKGRSLSSSERPTPSWIDLDNPIFPSVKRLSLDGASASKQHAPEGISTSEPRLLFPSPPRAKSGGASTLATIPSSPLPVLDAPTPVTPFFDHDLFKPSFAITPPSATLPSSRSWPLPSLSLYSRPDLSVSAPDLISAAVASAPAMSRTLSDGEVKRPVIVKRASEAAVTQLVGKEEKRYHALLELVETERGYLDSLRVLVKGYFQTLPFLDVLTSADIASVVRNAEALLELHERIAVRLVQVEQELGWMTAETDPKKTDAKVRGAAGRVARVFTDELPNFALYDEFCSQHGEAIDIVRSIEMRPEWEAYERQCALAASIQSTSGETTPLALSQPSSAPFFPIVASTSRLPPASPLSSPTTDSLPLPPAAAQSTQHRKLRFHDYAIKPVQRICRYPLVLGAVLKNLDDGPERTEVKAAWDGMRKMVEGVDEAKRVREGELRTRIVAARMEFQAVSHSTRRCEGFELTGCRELEAKSFVLFTEPCFQPQPIGWAFCDVLGPTLLIGTLHVLHRSPLVDTFRNKYYGCFLYRSHLVMVKIRKRDSYEPRDWLPLRQFTIEAVEEGEGFLPCSIRLSYQDHHFELGATCAAEKAVWLNSLVAAQQEAQRQWDEQPLQDEGQPTLFDDTLVSSVYAGSAPTPTSTPGSTTRRPHVRSTSAVSARSFASQPRTPTAEIERRHSYFENQPPMPALPVDASPTVPYPTLNRNRFSTTASSILGRTPTAQRQTIDLRLADVFSEECLAARAQAARSDVPASISGSARRRAISSAPKTNGGTTQSVGRMTAKERRRMSCIDVGAKAALEGPDFRGGVGFDIGFAQMYRDEPLEKSWTASIKRAKSGGVGRTRPVLPEIDTALAESKKSSGSLKSRAMSLRRAASQSSLIDGRGRIPVQSILFSTSPTASPTAVDVERNNSVSSTASSSGTHSTTYSPRAIETPLSSLPPSPELSKIDFEHFSRTPPTPVPAPRWPAGQSLTDGVSKAFKLKRRSSQLALPTQGSLERSHLEPTTGASLSRRGSTIASVFGFGKRVQSSPSLTNFFGTPVHSYPSTSSSSLFSASTPYLPSSGSGSETPSPPASTAPPSPAFSTTNLPPSPDATTKKSNKMSMSRFKFQASNAFSPVV